MTARAILALTVMLSIAGLMKAAESAPLGPGETPPATKAKAEAVKAVKVADGGTLLVNGKPFFPLMNFYQSPESFKNAEAMGLNSYFMPGNKPEPKEYLDALAARGLYGMVPFDEEAVGHPALLGWVLPHEPDKAFLSGKEEMSPERMAEQAATIRKADPHHPVVLDLSPRFMPDPLLNENLAEEERRKLYRKYADTADVLTFNVYPIWGHNKPERINWVAEAADELTTVAGPNRPFLAMIETDKGFRGIPVEEQKEVSAAEIRSEVWMAITGGARGIIYFTHRFTPKFTEHAPDTERHAEILKINQQITRLAPAILAPQPPPSRIVSMKIEGDLACRVKATLHEGEIYIFAQNVDMQRRGGKATFTVAPLPTARAEPLAAGTEVIVVDEGRTLATGAGGVFTDTFEPLAVHIYRLKM